MRLHYVCVADKRSQAAEGYTPIELTYRQAAFIVSLRVRVRVSIEIVAKYK